MDGCKLAATIAAVLSRVHYQHILGNMGIKLDLVVLDSVFIVNFFVY